MGDAGSIFLGGVFSGMVLMADSWSKFFCYILLLTPLLADAFSCVVRRFSAGHPIFTPHKLHLYQRLYQAGLSHSFVSSLYILASILLAIAFLWGGPLFLYSVTVAELIFGYWLDQNKAVAFSVS